MKLMKMSYNNKKKKQTTLAKLNKQKNNTFLESILQICVEIFSTYTHPTHMRNQNQTG